MKTGISTASLFLKESTEKAVLSIQEMGAETIEIFLSTFSEYEQGFVSDIRIDSDKMRVNSMHVLSTQFEPQLFSLHKQVRADAEYWLRKVCAAAQTLGAKNYTFHGPLHLKRSPLNIDMGRFAEQMEEVTEIAAEYDVTVCYENVHYGFFSRPQFFSQLAKRCPKLGMCLDIKHAAFSGFEPAEYMDNGGDRIKTLHIVDMSKDGEPVLPGRGGYNFEKLFKDIKVRGLEPAVLIEAYNKCFTEKAELKNSLDYIKNIMKDV